jgi:hypothetical protein
MKNTPGSMLILMVGCLFRSQEKWTPSKIGLFPRRWSVLFSNSGVRTIKSLVYIPVVFGSARFSRSARPKAAPLAHKCRKLLEKADKTGDLHRSPNNVKIVKRHVKPSANFLGVDLRGDLRAGADPFSLTLSDKMDPFNQAAFVRTCFLLCCCFEAPA